ncbi:hypothetical protein [Streptomyces adelaidensis]|uniref:hypothetical protein n=1 Tax=Streptomyces adelaidensis TaxID=2796465 RepID=UPI0019053C05|nr:hypothetical protein [Streptomyces adelaidensis]
MTTSSAAPAPPPAGPVPPDRPDVSALLGDWLNTDRGAVSKGPLRLTVTDGGTSLSVRAIGSEPLRTRDWGEVPAAVHTAPGAPSVVWSFTAVYELDGSRTVLSAYHKTGILVVTASRIPLDGERPGEWTRSFFHRFREGT